jgi:hypothetical protein
LTNHFRLMNNIAWGIMRKNIIKLMALLFITFFFTSFIGLANAAEPTVSNDQWSGFGGGPSHTHQSTSSSQGNQGGLVWQFVSDSIMCGQPVVSEDGTIYVNDISGHLTMVHPNGTMANRVTLPYGCVGTPALGLNGTVAISTTDVLYLLDKDLNVLWSLDLWGRMSSPVISEEGIIYITTFGEGLISLHGLYAIYGNGEIKWFIPNVWEDSGKVPAIGPDGTIFYGGSDLPIRAVSPNGDVLWEYYEVYPYPIDIGERGSYEKAPICVGPDGTAYVGTSRHNMYAFGPDGSIKWKYEAPSDILACASLGSDGTVLFSTCRDTDYKSQRLYALDHDGEKIWSYKYGSSLCSPAVISSEGNIYFYDQWALFALDGDGDLIWKREIYTSSFNLDEAASPVIGNDGAVYMVYGAVLKAFDIGTPSMPREVRLERDGTKARLTWDHPSTDGGGEVTGYTIYRQGWAIDGGIYEEYHLVATLTDDERSFHEDNLSEGMFYAYTVAAINEYGTGDLSDYSLEYHESSIMGLILLIALVAISLYAIARIWVLE